MKKLEKSCAWPSLLRYGKSAILPSLRIANLATFFGGATQILFHSRSPCSLRGRGLKYSPAKCGIVFRCELPVLVWLDCVELKTRRPLRPPTFQMEAPPRFELGNNGFANRCLNHLAMAPWTIESYACFQRMQTAILTTYLSVKDLNISSSIITTLCSSPGRCAAVMMIP